MRSLLPKRSDWRSLRIACIAFSIIVLTLAWGITLQRLHADKALAIEAAKSQQNNLAIIIAENFRQLLDGAQAFSISANDWWGNQPQDEPHRLRALRSSNAAFLSMSLYDRQAQRVWSSSSLPDNPALLASIRNAVHAMTEIKPNSLIVPELPALPEYAWHKPLLLPVGTLGTKPAGMLMLMLDMGHLLKVYQNISLGSSGVIHILGQDAREILEWRPDGLVFHDESRTFPVVLFDHTSTGSLTTDLLQNGTPYLSTFSRVGPFPFTLVVSRSLPDILQGHQQVRAEMLAALSILTILIAASTYLIARSIRWHGDLFAKLTASHDSNRHLIARLEDEKSRASILAAYDHLTGLHNRRTFQEQVTHHLQATSHHKPLCAMMYLDLDQFKTINDTLGHHVGDLLLRAVASRLRDTVRSSDIVARLGGDEFAILLTNLAHKDDLTLIANKLIAQISEPVQIDHDQTIRTSPSIGIAIFPRDGQDFESLCKNADTAMYESKRKGRSTHTYYDASLNPTGERIPNLRQRLAEAIDNNELTLHFQPKVQLSDFSVAGFEALVRWQHPELGLIYPNDFIPQAEENGLIIELGEWVARECCRQQAAWRAEGEVCLPISINISALQLQREGLPALMKNLLDEYSMSADMIELEITETVLLASQDIASKVLYELEALGFHISLDDFGSGYSSLSYIRTLPIHTIKIDKQFISGIHNSPQDNVLTNSIITLAHNLKMQVVAEGLETLEQLIHLKTSGCDLAQGYYFSRPVSAEHARNLLRHQTLLPQKSVA